MLKHSLILSTATIGLCSSLAHAAAHQAVTGASAQPETHHASRASDFQDIVVTARRREESLQSVPVAISAVTPEALEQKGIRSVEDLRVAVPGLNISGQRRGEASFYIRGQGPGIFNTGQRNFTSVAIYFAEVPADIAGSGTFYDLANVQVLKGPQGTLFGRNTTGGAVLFEPKRPTFDAEGTVKVTIGNYDYRDVEAMLNIPLVQDILSIRLAGTASARDGYTTSIITGQVLDERNYHAYRASVLFTPFDDFENLTIVDRAERDQSGTSAILRSVNPEHPLAAAFLPYLRQQQALGVRKTMIPTAVYDRGYSFGVTNKTVWNVSDTLTLKNIVSFRKNRTDRASDYDGTPVQTFLIENAPPGRDWQYGQEQVTEEFQIQGKAPALNLSYILGFYHEVSKPGFPQEIRQSLFGTMTVRHLDSHDRSDAVFAHAELELSDQWQLSGGFRHTWDKRRASISVFNAAGQCTQQVPPGVGPIMCPFSAKGNFKAPTYDATLQYSFSDRALTYISYRHGYKSGGVNLPAPTPEFTSFDPEYVDEFEIGLKADWDIGMPLRTNLSVFLDKYKDIQISSPVVIPNVAIVSVVQNAAKATNKGIEFEGTLQPTDTLSIGGFFSYLDASSDVTVPGTGAVKGRQTAFQPKWKFGLNARLDVPLADDVGDLAVSADYSWQSRTNTNEVNPAVVTTYPSYGLLNGRIEFNNIAETGLDVAIFGTNLTNKKYILGGFPMATPMGFETALYGEPRMYGISGKFHF
ncbi:MAG TPA: TonB-dependent receptor [Pedomonas sp.]